MSLRLCVIAVLPTITICTHLMYYLLSELSKLAQIFWNSPLEHPKVNSRLLQYGGDREKAQDKHWTDRKVAWSSQVCVRERDSEILAYHCTWKSKQQVPVSVSGLSLNVHLSLSQTHTHTDRRRESNQHTDGTEKITCTYI